MNGAYEHINGICSECLENLEVFDSKEILSVPSVAGDAIPQFTIENMEPLNLRWVQHVRMPDEPHIQGRIMEGATRLEQSR